MAGKFVKLGTVLKVTDKDTNEARRRIKLGQEASKDPVYDYKVEVRITDSKGNVTKLTNPWVNINDPHPKAPSTILGELQVYIKE